MEWTFIALIVGFIILAFLVFKLVKKVVVAAFSVFFLFILIFGLVGGLVYFDVKALAEKRDYDIQMIYEESSGYELGIEVPVRNQTPQMNNTGTISTGELEMLSPEDIDEEEGKFVILFDENALRNLTENKTYSLGKFSLETYSIEPTLKGGEVMNLLESNSAESDLVDILIGENMSEEEKEVVKPILEEKFTKRLEEKGLGVKEMLFLLIIKDSIDSKENMRDLLENYQAENIKVYPERTTFTLVKWLPVDFVASKITSSGEGN